MNQSTFISTLKNAQEIDTIKLCQYALTQLATGNPSPAGALLSSPFSNETKKLFRLAGVHTVCTTKRLEAPAEWKGLKIKSTLAYKKGVPPAFRQQLAVMAETLPDLAKEAQEKAAKEKAEKREAEEKKKQTVSYWQNRIEKIKTEAKKHGVTLDYKISFSK